MVATLDLNPWLAALALAVVAYYVHRVTNQPRN